MPAPPRPDSGPPTGDERRLVRYLRRTVYPYSEHYRSVIDADGRGTGFDRDDLVRLAPTDLSEIADPAALVLRPDLRRIVRGGDRGFALRTVAAKAIGGMYRYNRHVVERRFKPVHWILGDGIPIGYSAADLQRMSKYGADWLERAGVGSRDVVVSLLAPGPTVAHWQLVSGCRRAGVSAIHLDPSAPAPLAEGLAPSVLVGDPQHLIGLLARDAGGGDPWANLSTLIAVGDPLSAEVRGQLRDLARGATVVAAWSPPGVRAVWTECRQGAGASPPAGYHAWDDDVLELAPGPPLGGELLWTGVGWRGSALVRLRSRVAVVVERSVCPACGRRQPRIVPIAPLDPPGTDEDRRAAVEPLTSVARGVTPIPAAGVGPASPVAAGVEAILDAEAEVAAWQVEYRTHAGAFETIVVLAPAWGAATVPLIRRLDRHLRATQFVVLPVEDVVHRIAMAEGMRIIGEAP